MYKKVYVIVILLFLTASAFADDAVRVACVGDSITYGSRIENRLYNAYPFQLGRMMGSGYEVRNFGVSGATMLRNGNKPYNTLPAFQDALQFIPDVVLIKLGTNDSKLINRPFFGEFKSDCHQLIAAFRNVNPETRIILLVPVPAFNYGEPVGISPETISQRIIPLVEEVAYEAGCEILDLYHVFSDREQLFPDKVHPNREGAAFMALRIQEALLQRYDPEYDLVKKLGAEGEEFNFHGFRGLNFTREGLELKVVRPWRVNPDHSWIIRARFFGHEPQVDVSLLERGFHLVYCDVADLYGAPEAVERWSSCYRIMLGSGLQCKVALEGMSRGGLIIYNWAAANPEKVSCIYADAPVLDINSWPGDKGRGKGSGSDWEKCLDAYGLETEEYLQDFIGSPISNALILAKSGKPLLHVYGESDQVVPPEENTIPFAEKIRSNGGNIMLIAKPGIGHHPHSLINPSRITEFILASTPLRK
jgi:lysophospholipase L1-like esterase